VSKNIQEVIKLRQIHWRRFEEPQMPGPKESLFWQTCDEHKLLQLLLGHVSIFLFPGLARESGQICQANVTVG
jgi:hypothetical protein